METSGCTSWTGTTFPTMHNVTHTVRTAWSITLQQVFFFLVKRKKLIFLIVINHKIKLFPQNVLNKGAIACLLTIAYCHLPERFDLWTMGYCVFVYIFFPPGMSSIWNLNKKTINTVTVVLCSYSLTSTHCDSPNLVWLVGGVFGFLQSPERRHCSCRHLASPSDKISSAVKNPAFRPCDICSAARCWYADIRAVRTGQVFSAAAREHEKQIVPPASFNWIKMSHAVQLSS